ncbi:polygalacturonase inhibitor-like [Salvia hispanica]|uniref:polygalacturonase inhibitor-like n=1 Tax=Salvia hispanica TaxID=49212 RepID=UPI0020096EAE|nr:polygalacturonase inhibitor-like [Salvia hispanica]
MRSLSLLLILSLIAILSQPTFSKSVRCHPQDKKVLLKIKQHFNNAYTFASWNPDIDCCTWYIAKCDRVTNRITKFILKTADDVVGPIPDAMGDLPHLEYLTFHKLPNLIGTIPPAITKLTNLKDLTITWTNVSGPIPPFLSQLNNLTGLSLSFNNLTGSIPPSLVQLRLLGSLFLDRNRLTGSIPEALGDIPASLTYIDLSHNQLSGEIPKGWSGFNFESVQLERNRLEGDASGLFGKSKSIWRVDLSRNVFAFDLTKMEIPDSLRYLDMNHNKIFGSLPAGFAPLSSLNVSYNRLCGRIPTGGVFQEMEYSSFFHNKCLCGPPLPDCK